MFQLQVNFIETVYFKTWQIFTLLSYEDMCL